MIAGPFTVAERGGGGIGRRDAQPAIGTEEGIAGGGVEDIAGCPRVSRCRAIAGERVGASVIADTAIVAGIGEAVVQLHSAHDPTKTCPSAIAEK